MERPKFSVRDLLWLVLVVGIGLGWWMDQDRIRRQSEALQRAAQRVQVLPVRGAEAKLRVIESELASMNEVNQRSPGAIPESELQRVELQFSVAKIDLEKARMGEVYGSASSSLVGQKPKLPTARKTLPE